MKKCFLLFSTIISSACITFAQTDEEKDQFIKQVKENDKKLEFFIEKGQTDSIAELYSPNCHLINEFGTILESRESVSDFYLKEKKAGRKYTDFSLNVLEHKVYDEIVLEIGTNTIKYSIGADKRLYTATYNYMFVWKQSKSGKFQIRAAMWNLPKNPCNQ